MNTKKTFYLLLATVALTALLLSACGGTVESLTAEATEAPAPDVDEVDGAGDSLHDEHETSSGNVENASTITIIATEFGFEPASIELQAGEPVNIMLVNEGAIDHELQIEDFDFHVHALPGESAMAGFTPEVSGTYEFACLLPGHYEAGMIGDLEVVDEHDD